MLHYSHDYLHCSQDECKKKDSISDKERYFIMSTVMNNALVGIRVDKPNSFSVITKLSLLGVEI